MFCPPFYSFFSALCRAAFSFCGRGSKHLPIRAGFDPLRLSYCAYLQDVASNSACAFSMLIGVNKS